MRKALLQLLKHPLQAGVKWYLSRPRTFRYEGLVINVSPGVFHPGFFFSTKILLQYLSTQSLNGKTFLELGCGSGTISIFAAKKGAQVTASDINTKAVRDAAHNGLANGVTMQVVHSDLFASIDQRFDWIVINPPYYPAQPKQEEEYAWYCGEEHEYFETLFSDLKKFTYPESKVLMILSDVCNIDTIFSIARRNGLRFEKILEKNVWADGRNYLFWIKLSDSLA
jgi:release factor glutamine methyltransferase